MAKAKAKALKAAVELGITDARTLKLMREAMDLPKLALNGERFSPSERAARNALFAFSPEGRFRVVHHRGRRYLVAQMDDMYDAALAWTGARWIATSEGALRGA